MSTEQTKTIPDDFPRQGSLGGVSGVQTKLLARKIDGRFLAGPTEAEFYARFDNCADLVVQLTEYIRRKLASMPGTSVEDLLPRVRQAVELKSWDVSRAEMDWIFTKIARELGAESP
ncbi:hypothetical protein [Hydrogenophaga crocea]|uniref:Uncharacterized protein n=1 Tax=Hydrogenophaga crocea TaxID=2716225 RepID=A0A6G8IHR2_9BURK|nr:hypothetical protein [Hydrogenophaga crocea]QIM52737.1 hypothetical protein G9Q37_11560 [Hydrogenophaga crocea]